MSMSSPPGGFGGPPGGGPPPGGFGGPPGGGPPQGGFGGPPGEAPPGGGYGPPQGGPPQGGPFGGPPQGGPPGGFGGPPGGDQPPGGGYGPPPGGFGGPGGPPGGPPGGFGGPPQGGPPGGFGGPPGGGYGPPPGGVFGGPPQGGFGGPPQGGFGGPPGQQPQKKGPNVGLIIGLGCGGVLLIGIIVVIVGAVWGARKAAEEISKIPELQQPTTTGGGDVGGLPGDGNLKAELRDLREYKGTLTSTRYFVGEIHNTGTAPIGFPSAKVTLFDASKTAVDSGTCMSVIRVLPPGQKVPCTFLITGAKTYADKKIEITPNRAFFTGEIADLDIGDVKFVAKKRAYGAHELNGKITNKSNFTAKSVMAIVGLYDKNGKIVGATQVPVAGNSIAPQASALFEAKIFDVAEAPEKWEVTAVGYSE